MTVRAGFVAAVGGAMLALPALAQQDLPAGEKLSGRAAEGAFNQIASTSFMAPAMKSLQRHYPDHYARLREGFVRAAREQGVRVAVRGVSAGVTQAVVATRPKLSRASPEALNALLAAEVEALRALRDDAPAACTAFAESLAPPTNAAPSEESSALIFRTIGLALSTAAAAPGDGPSYQMTPEDRGLLKLDGENLRLVAQGGEKGRCQSYVTLFGTALAQPPARAARMYSVLLREAFSPRP
jgi:hypothetical protein